MTVIEVIIAVMIAQFLWAMIGMITDIALKRINKPTHMVKLSEDDKEHLKAWLKDRTKGLP